MKKFLLVSFIIANLFFLSLPGAQAATSLANSLKGRILLQVEENGEAWYVNPLDSNRYYLGRPENAFQIMRSFGLGITNANLNKIPMGLTVMSGVDSDKDGLSDDFEKSQGTNIQLIDSDADGYTDKQEILMGYSPVNAQSVKNYYDQSFVNKLSGRILLQVESKGEAWYVNPVDGKRYYLGRAADAFAIMRSFGLGITNANLNKIEINSVNSTSGTVIGCNSCAVVCPSGYYSVWNASSCTYSCVAVNQSVNLSLILNSNDLDSLGNENLYEAYEYVTAQGVQYPANVTEYVVLAGLNSSYLTASYISASGGSVEISRLNDRLRVAVKNLPQGYHYIQLAKYNANHTDYILKSAALQIRFDSVNYYENRTLSLSVDNVNSSAITLSGREYYNNVLQLLTPSDYELWGGSSSSYLSKSYFSDSQVSISYGNVGLEVVPKVSNLAAGDYYLQLVKKNSNLKSNVLKVTVPVSMTQNQQLDLIYKGVYQDMLIFEAKNYSNNVIQKPLAVSNYAIFYDTSMTNTNIYSKSVNYSVEFANDTVRFMVKNMNYAGTDYFQAVYYGLNGYTLRSNAVKVIIQ